MPRRLMCIFWQRFWYRNCLLSNRRGSIPHTNDTFITSGTILWSVPRSERVKHELLRGLTRSTIIRGPIFGFRWYCNTKGEEDLIVLEVSGIARVDGHWVYLLTITNNTRRLSVISVFSLPKEIKRLITFSTSSSI